MADDLPEKWMRRAIMLSRRGFPAPNPHVGCVLVSAKGEIVGEGWHEFAGGLHAEAAALRSAGSAGKGTTAYVTLEPCNHVGRQPACSWALIEAGVRRVVYACPDPNPRVEGGGHAALDRAGIEVEGGYLESLAADANRPWLESMSLRRPFVTLKAAMSLDGRIALPSGESKWITGERARREAHRLRAEMGCVLVGSGTVLQDDPALTARIASVRNQPIRVVLDPERAVPNTARVFKAAGDSIRVVCGSAQGKGELALAHCRSGFDLGELLAELWRRGITGILVEGGTQTLTSFLEAGFADRIALFVGNVVLGSGRPWIEARLFESVQDATRWPLSSVRRIGDDVLMKFDRIRAQPG